MKTRKVQMGPHGNEMCDHYVELTDNCIACEMIATSAAVSIGVRPRTPAARRDNLSLVWLSLPLIGYLLFALAVALR